MIEALARVLELPDEERVGVPLTYRTDAAGHRYVLSRYGDDRIDLSPYIRNPAQCRKYIDMTLYPPRWRNAVLELLIAYWRYGRAGRAAPKAGTVLNKSTQLVAVVNWLDARGVSGFRGVRPIHLSAFAEAYVAPDASGRRRKSSSLAAVLGTILMAWDLRERLSDPMESSPLGSRASITALAKLKKSCKTVLVTESLSDDDAFALAKACEEALVDIDDILADYQEIAAYKCKKQVGNNRGFSGQDVFYSMPHLYGQWRNNERRINDARAACFTLIGLLVGTRISESLLLESDCYFESEVQGETVGWVRGKTLKMRPDGAEATEWLAPPKVRELVGIMNRIVAPVRERLLVDFANLEAELANPSVTDVRRLFLLEYLREGRACMDRIFLSEVRNRKKANGGSIRGAGRGAAKWIQRMAKKACLKIRVHPHMLRRTYAVMVVLQCAGDLRYLRKQFQHWSIETTQLYASHSGREQELMDEIADEMLKQKVDLVTHWLSPNTLLAGPGGEHIKGERAKPEFRGLIESDLRTVATHLSEGLVVRANGHTWCISTPVQTCGGQGLYDASKCSGCSSSVVTEEKRNVWELLAQQMLEVQQLGDTGPVGRQLVERSLEEYDAILQPFGSSVEIVARQMEVKA